jgi:hypothetical protein
VQTHVIVGKRDRAPRLMARDPAWRVNARRADSSARRYKDILRIGENLESET